MVGSIAALRRGYLDHQGEKAMRKHWNHTPPPNTQPEPPDNTSEYVMRQVRRWEINTPEVLGYNAANVLVHPESAMEIAAWWQSPGTDGIRFAQFASTGTIVEGLAEDIEREIRDLTASDHDHDNANALRALLAYVKACETDVYVVSEGVPGQVVSYQSAFVSSGDAVTHLAERIEWHAANGTAGEGSGAGWTTDEASEHASELEEETDARAFALDEIKNYGGTSYPFGDLVFRVGHARMTYGQAVHVSTDLES